MSDEDLFNADDNKKSINSFVDDESRESGYDDKSFYCYKYTNVLILALIFIFESLSINIFS